MRRWKPRSQHRRRTGGFIDAWKRWADAEQLRWAAGWRAAELQADRVFLIATQSRKREPSKRASIGTAKAVPFRLRRTNILATYRGIPTSQNRDMGHTIQWQFIGRGGRDRSGCRGASYRGQGHRCRVRLHFVPRRNRLRSYDGCGSHCDRCRWKGWRSGS